MQKADQSDASRGRLLALSGVVRGVSVLARFQWVLLCVAAAGCGGAESVPANTRADPGALIACRDFLTLAEREDKDRLTNEQFRDGLRTVREKAFAANPASDV